MSERSVLRRCVTCRELLDRRLLWRVIRLADGGLALDQGMGRSAYLCPKRDCLEEARRRKKLQKGLRCQVADSIYAALEQRLHATSSAGSEAR
ncbi:YlxR family protein [Synechococcus sp. CB0101]|uniref:YlxR family protein n=1 Tax=Synechococcus sp. CB0101 TaxID=232348 RepID=UPI000497F118|nr:YlxR family protein [Synechococcus sp. CB0101]QCH14718.1 YlxR family protein [Synechococcus sp. CB0101]